MKYRNIGFILFISLSCLLIYLILLFSLQARLHRTPIQSEIDPQQPMIAITFDDGPNASYTLPLLDLLYKEQVPATFFVVGEAISGNENILREMAARGHEIEIHSFSHPDLTTLAPQQIREELWKTEERLQTILPDYHARYFRPPYGKYNQQVQQTIPLPLVLWTLDSGDWDHPQASSIYDKVIQQVQNQDILIFHDDNPETIKALKKLIPELKKEGFQFVTISSFLEHASSASVLLIK